MLSDLALARAFVDLDAHQALKLAGVKAGGDQDPPVKNVPFVVALMSDSVGKRHPKVRSRAGWRAGGGGGLLAGRALAAGLATGFTMAWQRALQPAQAAGWAKEERRGEAVAERGDSQRGGEDAHPDPGPPPDISHQHREGF